jgi:hypothetical protein
VSDETSAGGGGGGGTAAAAAQGALVDQLGLSPRGHRGAATNPAMVQTMAALRRLYGLIQRYFPQILMGAIAAAAVGVYHNGGWTLMGQQI